MSEIIKAQYIPEDMNQQPLIKANINPFWVKLFDYSFTKMLEKNFYSIRIKNLQHYYLRDRSKGNLAYAFHSCWWDGIIGYILCRKVFKKNLHMMIEELHRLPLLSKIGGFSVEKSSAQSSMKSLSYSSQILQDPSNILWIFPQGFVNPPDFRPIRFANGVSYLCKKINGVNLLPIAHRYTFLREDRPELLIEIGKPIILNDNSINRRDFTKYIEEDFTKLLDNQKEDIANGNLQGYEFFHKSKLCIPKRIEKHFSSILKKF